MTRKQVLRRLLEASGSHYLRGYAVVMAGSKAESFTDIREAVREAGHDFELGDAIYQRLKELANDGASEDEVGDVA